MNSRTSRPGGRGAGGLAVVMVAGLLGAACGGSRSADEGSPDTSAAIETASTSTSFGTLESPCGPGQPSSAPDQGVDASTVTIGYGDDAGYTAAPGTGHEGYDAMKAMIDWCNDQGGINGRTIKGNYYDAQITEIVNVVSEACTQVFMLVGQNWALGDSG